MDITGFDAPSSVKDDHPHLFAPHVERGTFFNPWQGREKPKVTDLLKWQLSSNPWSDEKRIEQPVPPRSGTLDEFRASDRRAKLMWLGHATFLIEIDGLRCLVDPVYGTVGAFVKRFSEEPFPLDALGVVDAVFLSHGHYDHLDVQTLDALAKLNPDTRFFAGLGQERYLPRSCAHVHTVDWWTRVRFGGVSAIFVPVQHWHRRGLFDYNAALWGGWVLQGSHTFFHAGDSGYFDGFGALGRLFDIDVAILPVGAYEPRWFMKEQHMNPEEAIRVFEELQARQMVAMHWGTYDLTDEPLNRGADATRWFAADRGLTDRVHVLPPGDWLAA